MARDRHDEHERLDRIRLERPDEDLIARLVCEYMDRLVEGHSVDVDEIMERHPRLGLQVVRELETFSSLSADPPNEEGAAVGILGDYTLRRQIGRGGMGVVYEAWENSMERAVALKVLPAGIAADDKAFNRFMREARTAGKLSHRNIVPVFGVGIKEHTPYFAMEYGVQSGGFCKPL